ncbi:MAG TPA: hypothetical protein VGO37_14055 [Steroidobacteraceae bacterium]|nr:hypothetical protein [Steroidobacteraceae bacterium]
MASYKILLKAIAAKEYEAIASKVDRRRVLWKIAALSVDPRPAPAGQLTEREDQHRIHVAQHRVIYQIDERQKRVTVFRMSTVNAKDPPGSRPLQGLTHSDIATRFEHALANADGMVGAHCIHELWMRGEMSINIERALERLWARAAESVPEWLPMRYIEWLPAVYEVALKFRSVERGRSNIYLVLLDYQDRDEHGVYVGMSRYSPAQRFDQHKAGIRAAGSVLKRGLEVLTGPTLHLQYIKRSEASRIEEELARALASAGLLVKGGH